MDWILGLPFPILLLILAVTSFIQNMAFTAVSRSRNAGNLLYHFKTAIGSNGIWFFCNFFILLGTMLKAIMDSNFIIAIIIAIIYTFSTALGSVFMMAIKLGRVKFPKGLKWLEKFLVEEGNKQVGKR